MKRFALWLILATAAIAAFSSPALARLPNVQPIGPYGDTWMNYDFDITSAQSAYADFPVGIIWRGSTTAVSVSSVTNYIRAGLGPGYPTTGSNKYSYVTDGGSMVWNTDGGKMTNCYTEYGSGKKRHIRVYAPYDQRFYNTVWGYYVISNVHVRQNNPGCSSGTLLYGWSEDYEGIVLSEAAADGYYVDPLWYYPTLNTGEYWEPDNIHYQKSDGYARSIAFQ